MSTAEPPDGERQPPESDSERIISVSQLNSQIASIVENPPALDGVRCIGEVTHLYQNSTALYFTLTDVVGDGDQAAAVE